MTIVEKIKRANEMAPCVKALVHADKLSSIPGTHIKEQGENTLHKLCFNFHRLTVECVCASHTILIKFKIKRNKNVTKVGKGQKPLHAIGRNVN